MLTIFNIQRYSLEDGNGVRTNIFFKGCPLKCLWCNNPESIDPFPSIMFDDRLCRAFGDCIKASQGFINSIDNKLFIDRSHISDFSLLRDACPSKALNIVGQSMTPEQIITEVEKDIPFYLASGGGVTLSGGEPLGQNEDLIDLLIALKSRNIHISVETSLHLPWESIEKYTGLIDVFLADLKHIDSDKFFRYTGGNVSLVMNNFRELSIRNCAVIARIPVIPDFNSTETELFELIDFAAGLKNVLEINFIPFHSLAKEKYIMLGKDYAFENYRNIQRSELDFFVEYSGRKGLTAKILN